jgi:hypothetical protein
MICHHVTVTVKSPSSLVPPFNQPPVPCALVHRTRGENGSGISIGYRIRIMQISVFSDTDSVFLYSGRIRVVLGYCSFGYRSDTERGLLGKYPDIRVRYGYPEFGYPFFLFCIII